MANLENKSFSPDGFCLPPGQPAILGEFPTGHDYAAMNSHPGSLPQAPQLFAAMGAPDYEALVSGINDFSKQMFTELQSIQAKVPELSSPINVSFENLGMGDLNINSQAPGQPGNTSVNIGGNTLNVGGPNLNVAGDQNLNQFLFPPEEGLRKASVIPAIAKTKISGKACGSNVPGCGMVNLLYRVTVAGFDNEMEAIATNLRDKIHEAKQTQDWDGIQELTSQWTELMHRTGGLVEDPGNPSQDDTITQLIYNISTSEVAADTYMLVSPDANGQFWVTVASCEAC